MINKLLLAAALVAITTTAALAENRGVEDNPRMLQARLPATSAKPSEISKPSIPSGKHVTIKLLREVENVTQPTKYGRYEIETSYEAIVDGDKTVFIQKSDIDDRGLTPGMTFSATLATNEFTDQFWIGSFETVIDPGMPPKEFAAYLKTLIYGTEGVEFGTFTETLSEYAGTYNRSHQYKEGTLLGVKMVVFKEEAQSDKIAFYNVVMWEYGGVNYVTKMPVPVGENVEFEWPIN